MPSHAHLFHRVRDGIYDLTRVRTGSIRDQLLRSTTLLEDLLRQREIEGDTKPLLIYGAGPAGMNAALMAGIKGVSSTVIECEDEPFFSLTYSQSRRISPFEYDWPHVHYRDAEFPTHGSCALRQREDESVVLAAIWRATWLDWKAHREAKPGHGRIDLLKGDAGAFKVVSERSGGTLRVEGPWPPGAPHTVRAFGAVLHCVGPKDERTFQDPPRDASAGLTDPAVVDWNGFNGPKFWRDGFVVDAGAPLAYKTIVISGGGDGAMQDLQQITTGLFGKALLAKLQGLAGGLPIGDLAPPQTLLEVLCAEDEARRAHAWHNTTAQLRLHKTWAMRHAGAVDKVLASVPPDDLKTLARGIFRGAFDRGAQVFWNYAEETPGHCYALNRYLTLLLARLSSALWSSPHSAIEIRPRTVITRIQSTDGHVCGKTPCWPQVHRVVFSDGTEIANADLVIVRHGLKLQDPKLFPGAGIGEQLVPYDVPW